MNSVRGGELFDKIVEYEFYSEKDAAELVYQIVAVVKYLHNKGIVHRDLKPENLLFEDETAKRLKLCDFGLAEKIKEGEIMYNVVGSPTYMAPEITLGTGYGKPVDMYSIGVIMYILLCGYPPFEPEEGIIDLEFPSPEWDSIADSVKKLISLLLEKDPSKRPTAEQVLQHPWISGDAASRKALVGTVRTMATYNTIRRNPGATMRHKDAGSKAAVMNLFAMGAPSPRAPHSSLLSVPEYPPVQSDSPEDGKKKRTGSKSSADKDKKERRKSQQPKKKEGDKPSAAAPFALSIGDASLRDLTKRMEELKGPASPAHAKSASPSNDQASKELTKLKEMYLAEKNKRLELEDQMEALTEAQKAADDAANKAAEELIETKKQFDEMEAKWEDEKVKSYDLKKERTALQDQLKLAHREVKEAKAETEKANRRATEAEKLQESTHKKLVEANAQLNSEAMKIKVETIVADRLESKRIKELEARIAELEAKSGAGNHVTH